MHKGILKYQVTIKFKVKNDKLIINREVMLGDVSSLGQVEIVSGLEEGDKVVLNPLVSLAE